MKTARNSKFLAAMQITYNARIYTMLRIEVNTVGVRSAIDLIADRWVNDQYRESTRSQLLAQFASEVES